MAGITGTVNGFEVMKSLGAICRLLAPDGTTSGDATLAEVGSPEGVPFVDVCGPGQAVVHFFGTVEFTMVGSLGVACASIPGWVAGSATPTRLSAHGGLGSDAFTTACPIGYVVTQLNVESGSFIDRIQGTCTRVRQ